MAILLAVDGGQTTTRVVLADGQGRILAQSVGGPSDHTEEPGGPERLRQVIEDTTNSALGLAGLPRLEEQEIAAACFGMTGETAIKQRVLEQMVRTPRLNVVHDSVNALMGATAGEPGLIVIAGTGSVARGMNRDGHEARVGGWGHLFGDEGSAFWIAREAIRAMAGELEGFRASTRLTARFQKELAVRSAYELMEKYYSGAYSRDHLASLAAWVNEAALVGDAVAERILKTAGKYLADLALAILELLFRPSGASTGEVSDTEPPIVFYSGGVFENQLVLFAFREWLQHVRASLRIEPPLLPPVLGSLLLACRSAGIEPSDAIRREWINAFAS